MITFRSAIIILFIYNNCETKAAAEQPEVELINGVVRGTIQTGANGKEVYVFYGIPFAKPPLGDLRFKRPIPYTAKWETPLDATKPPNTCAQDIRIMFPGFNGEDSMQPNTEISEDCLYVNVWVPVSQFKKNTNVYFWIHGGGFASGTSTLDLYNGATLAAEKDVIVVSTQYRLGAFGFLYLNTEDAPGNQGLVDQQLGLEWTNDNIKAFGGDPAEITLFGESAGGISVSYHLMAPGSKHLFKRAVIMSGVNLQSPVASFGYSEPAKILADSYRFLQNAGCKTTNLTESLKCLRNLPMQSLISAGSGTIRAPTIDGYFVSEEPKNLIKRWDAKRTEVLIGNVHDEGTELVLETFPKYFNHITPTSLPHDGLLYMIRQIASSANFSEPEMDAINQFYTNWNNKDDGFANQQKVAEFYADSNFFCPGRSFADQWSGRGLKVYYYLLTHRTEASPWGKWMGVRHTDDIPYFFGQPLGNSTFTKAEQDLSSKIIDLMYNFATTGKPSDDWERYTQDYPYYLDLNATIISDKTYQYGPRANQCAFWNVYLPRLQKSLENYNKASNKKCCCNKEKAMAN